MRSLEAELTDARALDEAELADAIEELGFECTRCGACCKGYTADEGVAAEGDPTDSGSDDVAADDADDEPEPHTATVFPDEVRRLESATGYDWRDVARPMPYGLSTDAGGEQLGETFEWALQTDDCGDCTFYEESSETALEGGETAGEADGGTGACTVHADRPLICRTYPFSVALGGTSQPMGDAVDEVGMVRAHECEGLDRDISRTDAEALAATLKARAVRELEEAIAVRDAYRPASDADGVVVHDSEGAKRPDGTPR